MPNDVILDVMHNKYFNYATEEDPVVYVPCKFYMFEDFREKIPQFETVHFDVDETDEADFCPGELSLSTNNADSLNNAFKIIEKIQRYQRVKIVRLDLEFKWFERRKTYYVMDGIINSDNITLCDQVEKTFPNLIKFNENTGMFRLSSCNFSKSVFEHLAEQLHGCKRINFLWLTDVEHNFPIRLGESIATMTSLEYAKFYKFAQTPVIGEAVLRGLSVCSQLVNLYIGESELTDCLTYLFLNSNHSEFPCLEKLEITDAKLSTSDLISLASGVRHGKLPRLKSLNLSQNIFTSKIGNLFGFLEGKYVGYPNLKRFSLEECMLNQADLRSISQALARNQLPKLQYLYLEYSTLTECIKDLFGLEVHSSFSTLTHLGLSCTQLSAADLRSLSRALSHRVMLNCEKLDLSKNKLTGIVAELFAGHGLPFVKTLYLESVQLNAKDIENIVDAIESAKLPALSSLLLTDNENCMTEDQVKQLLEACIAFFMDHQIRVYVTVDDSLDNVEFEKRITERCKGTNASLLWRPRTREAIH